MVENKKNIKIDYEYEKENLKVILEDKKKLKSFELVKTKLAKIFLKENVGNIENIDFKQFRELENQAFILNSNNVIGLEIKDYIGFELCKEFISFDNNKLFKIPKLEYKTSSNIECRYNKELVFLIMAVFDAFKKIDTTSGISFQMSNNYPMSISNKHLNFIIAPMGEG